MPVTCRVEDPNTPPPESINNNLPSVEFLIWNKSPVCPVNPLIASGVEMVEVASTVNTAPGIEVEVATAMASEAVVKVIKVPLSVQPAADPPPPPPDTQVPATEKQPDVKLIPLASVEVAIEVERIDPPVKVMPSVDLSPEAETPPTKVEVAEVAVIDNVPEV